MTDMLTAAKAAVREISCLSEGEKNAALSSMAEALLEDTDLILAANKEDVEKAIAESLQTDNYCLSVIK